MVFVSGKPIQPTLCPRPGGYPRVKHLKVLQYGGFLLYQQIDQAGKVCQGLTLQPTTKFVNYDCKKFYRIGPWWFITLPYISFFA